MSSSKRQTGSQDAVNSCSTAAGVEDLVVPSATVRAAARIIWMKKVDPQRLVRGVSGVTLRELGGDSTADFKSFLCRECGSTTCMQVSCNETIIESLAEPF